MSEQQEWFTEYDREVVVGAWRETRAKVVEWWGEVNADFKNVADAINSAFLEIAKKVSTSVEDSG